MFVLEFRTQANIHVFCRKNICSIYTRKILHIPDHDPIFLSSFSSTYFPSLYQIQNQKPTLPPRIGKTKPRQRVRQRVRRPPQVPEQALVPLEQGPPKFTLDNEEAIQVLISANYRDWCKFLCLDWGNMFFQITISTSLFS